MKGGDSDQHVTVPAAAKTAGRQGHSSAKRFASIGSEDIGSGSMANTQQEKRSRIASEMQDGFAASSEVMFFTGFPPEPIESLLTVEGAIVTDGGKLDVNEYFYLRDHFAKEGPPAQHPVPSKPGVKREEQENLHSLRPWSDAKGAGWIAIGPCMGTKTKDKWFSMKKLGSWRLAYLLARLQRDIWLSGAHVELAADNT